MPRIGSPILSLSAALAIAATFPGCASTPPTPAIDATSPARLTVAGDWDDIDPVLAGILPRFGLVESRLASDDAFTRAYRLDSLNKGPGSLTFRQIDDSQIEISVSIGRFGRPADEGQLIEALAERFTQLRGDVAAPIRRARPRP